MLACIRHAGVTRCGSVINLICEAGAMLLDVENKILAMSDGVSKDLPATTTFRVYLLRELDQ